ncbi:LarC family nickel insertion protein [bacterium]|nr:LarC family nickel insertion protein [bacterium]
MDLYFECNSGISGDMSVAALLDAGASKEKLEKALNSMKLQNEFSYNIKKVSVNAIQATDFDVIIPNLEEHHHEHHCHEHHHEPHQEHNHEHNHEHHHEHRNLEDVNKIIEMAEMTDNAKNLAKKIFKIVAQAESIVHGKDISEVHFHEVGAIDSIADIVSFSVLFDDISPDKVYFSTLAEGHGTIECQHGTLNIPVPAVCEIVSKYNIPIRITENEGEMVTPTGAAIVAALYSGEKLPDEIKINKVGYGAGKRKYKNPVLRVMLIN